MSRSRTPRTLNAANQRAIDFQIAAYDLCKSLGDHSHQYAFSNALTALRGCPEFIHTIQQARHIPYLTDGPMGQFVVSAANGETPDYLLELSYRASRKF